MIQDSDSIELLTLFLLNIVTTFAQAQFWSYHVFSDPKIMIFKCFDFIFRNCPEDSLKAPF